MKKSLSLVSLIVLVTITGACSGTSNPAAPTPQRENPGSFGVLPQATLSITGARDFGRCLQGSAESSCFDAADSFPTAAAIAAPGNLVATSSGSSVTLTWTAPSGETAIAYIIEAGSLPGLVNLANFSTGNAATAFSATGVSAGTYYVRVRAVGVSGAGPTSNEVVLVVGAGPCTGTPGAPSGLVVISNSGGTVVLQWNSAAGSPISYVVEAGSGSGLANLANSDLGLTTSLTATVGPGTYYIRIRAKNACGLGPPSNELVLVVSSAPGPGSSFGPGRHLVGTEIAPGRYYSDPVSGCYWERQSGLSGTLADVLANEFIGFNAGQWIVDILASDRAFQGDAECGTWFNTPRHGAQVTISPGMWLVRTQITPGTYRATAQYGCYWQRLRNFDGTLSAIIDNDFVSNPGTQFVSISNSDAGFSADDDCGVWTRVSGIQSMSSTHSVTESEIERHRMMNRRQNGLVP